MGFAEMLVKKKKTKKRIEIESLKSQRAVASSSNKRLRAETQRSSSSNSTSQTSYEEETEEKPNSSNDSQEPAWKLRVLLVASYKKLSVGQHRQSLILSDQEKMPINHVHFFDGNEDARYSGVVPFPDIQSDPLEEFNLNDSFHAICQHDSDMNGTVAFNLATNKREEAEATTLKDMANSNNKICAKILYNLLQNYTRKTDLDTMLATNPFIDVVFDYNCELTKAGFFTQLEGDYNIKPGVKYSAAIRQQKLDFLVFEIKCPNSVACDDFFKLTIELQIMLNRLITTVYGYKCQVYKMDLKSPAIYRLIKVRSCYLPRNHDDFDVVKNSLATFTQLHTLVYREVDKAKKCSSKISSNLSWIRYPVIHYKEKE